ncbi:hypothetical protein EG68_02631 [Paragonimus skrjabini miyazakii]|uniref:CD80-like immunoglobulin C2-set domain-containing protein n=1 Tax=Paragonimus skrjabini miyazakii TaxID=59628 RepID=A0A8S9ZAV0_9TREM|nr:hypothetical protein EG68_02631 [Paragonimus skrjabini miyazakii]
MKFKLFIGRQSNRPVCHLAINDAQYEQTGQYTCKTVHANSDGEIASATVLVFTPILDLRLKLENETSLVVDESAYVECVARGGKPLPKLRLQLGGEPVSQVGFAQRTDSPGVTVSTLTANIQLRSSHNWNLLTCHADMDIYGSVNQTFKVIYVQGYREFLFGLSVA